MKRMRLICLGGTGLLLGLVLSPVSAQTLSVYLSPPTDQASFITSGELTANFNDLTPGITTTPYVSPIGTYNFSAGAPISVQGPNQYGGAKDPTIPGNTGTNYIALGAQASSSAPITVTMNGNYNYFGFWFAAGDPNNGISFYSDNVLLARVSTATIQSLLSPSTGTVVAINNTRYNNSQYYGNPNTGENAGETYSYIDIVLTGATYNKIVLDNSGSTATGFESDNHTVYAGPLTIPGGDVFVTSVPVPEPSTYAIMALALVLCLIAGQRMVARIL